MFVASADGTEIFYHLLSDSGPTLIAGHGCLCEDDLGPLAAVTRLATYDVRSQGRSAAAHSPLAQFDRQVEDLAAVADRVSIDPFILLGWSFIGGVALNYAARHPGRVRRLILVNAMPPLPERSYDDADFRAERAARRDLVAGHKVELEQLAELASDPAELWRQWETLDRTAAVGDPAAAARLRTNSQQWPQQRPGALGTTLQKVFEGVATRDWRPVAREVGIPVLVIHGAADGPVQRAQDWVDALPDARLAVLEGIGHYPFIEAPEQFFGLVTDFVRAGS